MVRMYDQKLVKVDDAFAIFRSIMVLRTTHTGQVWERVSPRLQDKPEVLQWLRAATRPLAQQQS
jgi:hypothetical protein